MLAALGLAPAACGGKGEAEAAPGGGGIRLDGAVAEPRSWSVDGLASFGKDFARCSKQIRG